MSMGYAFNADEIFEMAERLERNGANFYREASHNVLDPQAKKMLIQLSQMEENHEQTYKELRANLKSDEKTATVFDPNNESMEYLRALADTRVFFEAKIDLKSMEEILKAAIMAEKESIVFYLGMKEIVQNSLGEKRIEQIINEEMGHITMLSRELMAVRK
jgi:rubrerythrin